MKKSIFFLLSALLFFCAYKVAFAQTKATTGITRPETDMVKPLPAPIMNYFGQDHYYTVTFRGNGEAVVVLKSIFSNITDASQSTVSFRVPKVTPERIFAFQVIRDPQCIQYEPLLEPNTRQSVEMQGTSIYPQSSPQKSNLTCLSYQQPDYYSYAYTQAKYKKASQLLSNDTITITLPEPIKPNATGSIILYFRAFGYTKKDLASYDFTFETLQTEDPIRMLQIGISTDSDLVLKGQQGMVNYRRSGVSLPTLRDSKATTIQSPQFDDFYQQIGQGTITKSSSNLTPLETYTMKGSYASSRLKLYLKEILIGILIAVVVLAFIFFLGKWLLHKIEPKIHREASVNESTTLQSQNSLLLSVGLSFAASLIMLIYTVGIFGILQLISTYSSSYYQFQPFLVLLLFVFSLAIYGLFFIGPSLYMGIKRGLKWGLVTFFVTIVWFLFYIGVIMIFILLLNGAPRPPILY